MLTGAEIDPIGAAPHNTNAPVIDSQRLCTYLRQRGFHALSVGRGASYDLHHPARIDRDADSIRCVDSALFHEISESDTDAFAGGTPGGPFPPCPVPLKSSQ